MKRKKFTWLYDPSLTTWRSVRKRANAVNAQSSGLANRGKNGREINERKTKGQRKNRQNARDGFVMRAVSWRVTFDFISCRHGSSVAVARITFFNGLSTNFSSASAAPQQRQVMVAAAGPVPEATDGGRPSEGMRFTVKSEKGESLKRFKINVVIDLNLTNGWCPMSTRKSKTIQINVINDFNKKKT